MIFAKTEDLKPVRATIGSAGYDLKASDNYIIAPHESVLIKTGIFLSLPRGIEAQIRSRSGLALKNKIVVLNSPGTIDSDYTGEICVILMNHSNEQYQVNKYDRIAQMIFSKYSIANKYYVGILSKHTSRGPDGFGSTGKS